MVVAEIITTTRRNECLEDVLLRGSESCSSMCAILPDIGPLGLKNAVAANKKLEREKSVGA